jgi:small subunit ribosomal protein S17
MEPRVNRRKFLSGEVVSDKMNKTRVVQVRWSAKHSKYEKTVRRAAKYKAHDEKNATKIGDVVRIMETRPISKDKRWVIMEVIQSGREEG